MGKPSLSGENLRIHCTIKSLILQRYPSPTENIQIQLMCEMRHLSQRLRHNHVGGVRGGVHYNSDRTG